MFGKVPTNLIQFSPNYSAASALVCVVRGRYNGGGYWVAPPCLTIVASQRSVGYFLLNLNKTEQFCRSELFNSVTKIYKQRFKDLFSFHLFFPLVFPSSLIDFAMYFLQLKLSLFQICGYQICCLTLTTNSYKTHIILQKLKVLVTDISIPKY